MSALTPALLPALEFGAPIRALHALLLPDRSRAATRRAHDGPAFELVEHRGADRAAVESFIRARFASSYGCRIESFMPRLFSVRNRAGEICGAFGLRDAHEPLFLEHYLDQPIEGLLAARLAAPVERQRIVEVGHFSGAFPGAVRAMIALLTERLYRDGCAWVAFTGTTELRNAFGRLGLRPLDLQAATIDRLPAAAQTAWGSYYDHAPRVLVGNVQEGYRAMHAACVRAGMATEAGA